MQQLVTAGVAPAEAAGWAQRSPRPLPGTEGIVDVPPGSSTARDGGGHTLALGVDADPAARGLGRAALRLDVLAVRDPHRRRDRPARRRRRVGPGAPPGTDRDRRTGREDRGTRRGGAHPVRLRIGGVRDAAPGAPQCAGAYAAGLRRRGAAQPADRGAGRGAGHPWRAVAGPGRAGTPERVAGGCAAYRPVGGTRLVASPSTANPRQLDDLLGGRGRPAVVAAAGPGWDPATLPSGVVRPADLAEAVEIFVAAAST